MPLKTITVKIKGIPFKLEVADSFKTRARGLMNRQSIKENGGMLFVFNVSGWYPFYMKNTLIPLDIIWLNRNKKVVFVKENVKSSGNQPFTGFDIVLPFKLAKYVVELNAGTISRLKIRLKDRIDF